MLHDMETIQGDESTSLCGAKEERLCAKLGDRVQWGKDKQGWLQQSQGDALCLHPVLDDGNAAHHWCEEDIVHTRFNSSFQDEDEGGQSFLVTSAGFSSLKQN